MMTAIAPEKERGEAPSALSPLSFEQEDIWPLHQMEDAGIAYNMPIAFRLEGDFDTELLRRAIQEVAQRHPAARMRFRMEGDEPVQFVSSSNEVEVREIGPFNFPLADSRADEELVEEARRSFDLKHEAPIRLSVLRFADSVALVLTMYHLVGDHSSLVVICDELSKVYNALKEGSPISLPELEGDYLSFINQQRSGWDKDRAAKKIEFWKKNLSQANPDGYVPRDFAPQAAGEKGPGSLKLFEVPAELVQELTARSRENGATIFMTLLAAFKGLLHRYSSQEDIVVGVPIDQRPDYDLLGTVGFFVRTLPFRTSVEGDPTFVELVNRIRQTTIDATRNAIPLNQVAESIKETRVPGKNPFFSIIFQYLAEPNPGLDLAGVSAEWLPIHTETAKFDLTFTLVAEGNAISAEVEFDAGLYRDETIERFWQYYLRFLWEIAKNPAQRISGVNLLEADAFEQVVREFNQSAIDYPRNETIHALLSAEAATHPEKVAMSCAEKSITYLELERQSNRLARVIARKAKPGDAVGIILDRGIEAIMSMLGILKAACAYVPLDPKLPESRLREIAAKASVRVVLASSASEAALPAEIQVIRLDQNETLAGEEETPLDVNPGPDAPAYILFTSGSTGGPKGVKVPHRAVIRLVKNTNFAKFGPDEVFLQLAPLSFDASTLEIWGALLNGGRVAVFPSELSSLQQLGNTIQREGVTTLWLTAGLFNQVIDENPAALRGVRQLLAGGDVLSVAHVRKAQSLLPGCTLINGYGPTENTTFTCCYRIPENWSGGPTVPIGKPISNTQVFILDKKMRPVPVGIPGELWAAGDGLALGYVGDEEATRKAFVANPFAPFGGERLYKTGDTARYLEDGTIEFLGRSDQQVKIRGFRIELAEIEEALRKHPEVQDCAVGVRNGNAEEKVLAAYVVRRSGKLDAADLRNFLNQKLASYMVPSHFLFLERIPTTSNGKVDRKALQIIPLAQENGQALTEEILDAVQARLLGIWREVLKRNEFSVRDNFFDLGGHSLLAVKMVSRVNSAFGINLTMRTIFQAPTIVRLAEEVRSQNGIGSSAAPILRRRSDSANRLLQNLSTLNEDQIDRLLKETTSS
jgi:amino acid adenylation domain-containing protein